MPADSMVTLEARPSAVMILAQSTAIVLLNTPEHNH